MTSRDCIKLGQRNVSAATYSVAIKQHRDAVGVGILFLGKFLQIQPAWVSLRLVRLISRSSRKSRRERELSSFLTLFSFIKGIGYSIFLAQNRGINVVHWYRSCTINIIYQVVCIERNLHGPVGSHAANQESHSDAHWSRVSGSRLSLTDIIFIICNQVCVYIFCPQKEKLTFLWKRPRGDALKKRASR